MHLEGLTGATKGHFQRLFGQPHRRGCLGLVKYTPHPVSLSFLNHMLIHQLKITELLGVVSNIHWLASQVPATNKESFELDACDLEVSFPLLFSLAHCLKKGVTVHWKEDLADAVEDCPQFAQDNNIIQSPSKYLYRICIPGKIPSSPPETIWNN